MKTFEIVTLSTYSMIKISRMAVQTSASESQKKAGDSKAKEKVLLR